MNRPNLIPPIDEARKKISLQLRRGHKIQKYNITSEAKLDIANSKRNMWYDYTKNLLESIDDNSVLVKEFHYLTPTMSSGEETLPEKIRGFKHHIDKDVNNLQSIYNGLDLISTSKTKSSNVKKDKKRTLTPAQKTWMWENRSRICIICKKEVKKQSDAHYDHIRPHVKGEKTIPVKMAITHALCNRLKGKKSLQQIQKELGTYKVKIKRYQNKVSNVNNMKYQSSPEIMEFSEANYLKPKDFKDFLDYLALLDSFHDDTDKPPMSAQRFVNLFKLMRECNLKVSEAINLRKGDFDVRHKIIMIRYPNSDKVQKTSTLPKDDIWIQKFLLNYNDEDRIFPVNTQTVHQYAKDACKLAGLAV